MDPRPPAPAPRAVLASSLLLALLLARPAPPADLTFHVRDRDFERVEPPAWVHEATRLAFVTSGHLELAARSGVEVIHTGGGSLYHPLRREDPSSGLRPEEAKVLREVVGRAKGHRMRIVCGIPPFAPAELVRAHPEWMVHREDSPAVEEKARLDLTRPENFGWRILCLFSPWGDRAIDCLAEILEDYGMDGFSFDGHYLPALCYCSSCKALYRRDAGRDLPRKADLAGLDYRLYMLWAGDRLEDWYRRLHRRLRQVNPEAVLNSWTVNGGRYGHFLTSPRAMSARMNLLFDCPMQEWWLDESNQGGSIVPSFGAAYLKAVTSHRPAACEPYLMSRGNPYGTDSFPRQEVLARAMLALTNGSLCAISFGWPGHAETAALVTREVERRSRWLVRAEPLPWAALHVGEGTRQFYGEGQPAERYLPHPLGLFRAAVEEHLPLTLLADWDLRPEVLARHRVLVLAGSACLSQEQVEAVRGFVAAGGGLVATGDASLFDEIGRPRPDFALADLFGVSHRGRPPAPGTRPELDANFALTVTEEYWRRRAGVAALSWEEPAAGSPLDDARLRELVPQRRVNFKGPLVRVTAPQEPMRVLLRMVPEGQTEPLPAAVLGERGRGRVVYLAAGLDAAYYSYWYPYQRRLLARAMEWAAGGRPPVEVKAPLCVQAGFFRQEDASGRRLLVHLYNALDTGANRGRPDAAVPLREELVPIPGIAVRFQGLPVKRARLEPEGVDLELRREGDSAAADLPPLQLHSILVAELE